MQKQPAESSPPAQNKSCIIFPPNSWYTQSILIVADERGKLVDFFEALQWTNWKNLTAEVKSQVFQQVVMYFVSPLKEITDVHFIKNKLCRNQV